MVARAATADMGARWWERVDQVTSDPSIFTDVAEAAEVAALLFWALMASLLLLAGVALAGVLALALKRTDNPWAGVAVGAAMAVGVLGGVALSVAVKVIA